MAESGLSIGLPELIQEVGFFLGHGLTGHSVSQLAEIMRIIQSGVRRVYYPPAVGTEPGYEWSWLHPTTTLTTVSGTDDYTLPDDFGRMVGHIHFPADEHRSSIPIVPESTILEARASGDQSGHPRMAAVRFSASDGAGGQRQEVMFYPNPDAVWLLPYTYEAYNGALSVANPYPLGGMQLAELYIESCLAVAESRLNDEIGNHTSQFQSLLVDAVARDRKRGATLYGFMGEQDSAFDQFGRQCYRDSSGITYNGDAI